MRAQVSTHSPPPTTLQTAKGGGREKQTGCYFYIVWCKEVKTDTDRCAHTDRTGSKCEISEAVHKEKEKYKREIELLKTCTSILRPSTTVPCNFSLALSASALFSKVTNPNPCMQREKGKTCTWLYLNTHLLVNRENITV